MHPIYCESLPESHRYNQLVLWFFEEGGELGVVQDIEKSRSLVRQSKEVELGEIEIVEVAVDGEPFATKGVFLGYDLSSGFNYSVLAAGLHPNGVNSTENTAETALGALLKLVRRSFCGLLNVNGLFSDIDIAYSCLEVVNALQQLHPDLWENDEVIASLEVVGVQLIAEE
jgi:hypothetical protein